MEDLSRGLRTSRNAWSASLFRVEVIFSSAAIANGQIRKGSCIPNRPEGVSREIYQRKPWRPIACTNFPLPFVFKTVLRYLRTYSTVLKRLVSRSRKAQRHVAHIRRQYTTTSSCWSNKTFSRIFVIVRLQSAVLKKNDFLHKGGLCKYGHIYIALVALSLV